MNAALPLTLFITAPLAAGDLLTVGPTGAFAEIQDALDAAEPGDVLLVQPGTYQPIAIDQPVRVVGDGTGDVVIASPGTSGVVVTGLVAGEEVVLAGIEVRAEPASPLFPASVLLMDNAGTVLLHDLRVSHPGSDVGVWSESCARVLLLGAEILEAGTTSLAGPNAAVFARHSELWIADSTITGGNDVIPAGSANPGDEGVYVFGGTLHVWRSTIRGGDGVSGTGSFISPGGGHAILAHSSSVTLYGGPEGALEGGDGALAFFGGSAPAGNGLYLAQGSTGRIQAELSIAGGFNAFGVQAPDVVVDVTSASTLEPFLFPTLARPAPQVALGGALDVGIDGHAGGVAVLFAALSSGPTLALSGVEGLGVLNPGFFVQVGAVGLDPSGAGAFHVGIPPAASLLGAVFFLQAAEASGAGLAITQPVLSAATL